MKTPTKFFGVLVVVMLALVALNAHAEGRVLCTITVGATATDTQQITDGGLTCPWTAGATVPMQCPNAKVCYDPAVLDRLANGSQQMLLVRNLEADGGLGPNDGGTLADGGAVSSTSVRGAVATTGDFCANFLDSTGSPDPYLIYLDPGQRNIGIIAAEIGDGGSTVNCKFGDSRRRIQ